MRMSMANEALEFTTGNANLDAWAAFFAGNAIAELAKKTGVSHPEALGLLQVILTFEIIKQGGSGLPYIQAGTVWMTEADKASVDQVTLDTIEAERERLFEKWKEEAQAYNEAAHKAITQPDTGA
jgi:hypothetical protein